jgi:thioredoxin 1
MPRVRRNHIEGSIMKKRLAALVLAAAAALTGWQVAHACGLMPYREATFTSAQAAGQPVLIYVTAPGCDVCRKQFMVLARLSMEPDFSEMTMLSADYNNALALRLAMNVQREGTLIMFKGKSEVARAVGPTDAAAIEALLREAL